MGHITDVAALMAKYPEMQKAGGATELDSAFIVPAELFIESYLSRAYEIPFLTTNQTAIDLTLDRAYYVYMRHRDSKRAKEIKEDLSDILKSILDGTVEMVTTSSVIVGRKEELNGVLWSSTQDYTPVFGMGDIIDFEVDPDQVTDEEDARS